MMSRREPRRPWWLLVGGLLTAGYSAATLTAALAWRYGLVAADGDAPLIVLIEALAWPALLAVPIGLVIVLWAFGIRHALAWLAIMALGLPLAALLWLVAVATLGGLTGKPL